MSAYHQMGHHSANLLSEIHLNGFSGAVLSPVNYDQIGISDIVGEFRGDNSFETIFDPQLYYPRTERQVLRNWPYFPNDVDTADITSEDWWMNLLRSLVDNITDFRPDAVCSPAVVPRNFSIDYYDQMGYISDLLFEYSKARNIDVLQTILVSLSDLADFETVMNIASVITKSKVQRVYLVLVSDVAPRRELVDPEEMKGAMLLVSTLQQNSFNVLVSHCSSDVVLWKQAGAESCASGKFFNLRRFTPSRWDENDAGGGQLAYWIEESLLTFLGESDISRVQAAGLISDASMNNPYRVPILECLETGSPWLGLSWRFFLYWFCDIESRIDQGVTGVSTLLKEVDQNWLRLEDSQVILEERRNNGSWVRQWLRAVIEYQTPW